MELNYLLVRSKKRKKTISLHLRKDGSIVIQSPHGVPKSEIDNFFHRKKDWLQKKIGEKKENSTENNPRNFLPGETFLFMGCSYPLVVRDDNNGTYPLTFSDHQFILSEDNVHEARALFVEWYREKAGKYIEERVCHYSEILQLHPGRVRIGNAKSRWGACSPDNNLSFAWRLVMAPCSVIDYVVVHEVAHIREKNHSHHFWNLLERVVPDYGIHRHWLRKNGHLLDV